MKKFTSEKTVMFTDMSLFIKGHAETSARHQDPFLPCMISCWYRFNKTRNPDQKDWRCLIFALDEAMRACKAAREMQAELFAFNKRSKKRYSSEWYKYRHGFFKNEDVFGEAVKLPPHGNTGKAVASYHRNHQVTALWSYTLRRHGLHQVKGK
jgi:hypothetical protein